MFPSSHCLRFRRALFIIHQERRKLGFGEAVKPKFWTWKGEVPEKGQSTRRSEMLTRASACCRPLSDMGLYLQLLSAYVQTVSSRVPHPQEEWPVYFRMAARVGSRHQPGVSPLTRCLPAGCVTQEAVEVTAEARNCSPASNGARILFSFSPKPLLWRFFTLFSLFLNSSVDLQYLVSFRYRAQWLRET